MSNFGDLEAHRRVLEEVRSSDSATVFMACLRAVAMSAFGSFHGLDTVESALSSHRHMEDAAHLRAILAIASVTASFSQGMQDLESELAHCESVLDGERSRIAYAREQSVAGAVVRSVNVSFGAAVSTVQIGGPNSGGNSSNGRASAALQARLEAQGELTVYMQAYLQFIRGFLQLWDELFGQHYSFPSNVVDTGLQTPCPQGGEEAERAAGGDAQADTASSGPAFSHSCCPPHLYAVNWKCVLTPERREWIDDQHEITRELLFRIVARELPIEAYLVYQLHATMTLRLRLLEAVAQLFVWSSCYVDVIVCVQQLYTNYRLQCEMARLQDLWASFKLFDSDFLRECGGFNSTCSEDQGAVIEHMLFDASSLAAAGNGVSSPATGTADTAAANAALARDAPRVQSGISDEFQASSGDDSASVASSRSAGAESGMSGTTAGRTGTRREFYTPLFPTRCHFTWLLQRACWSMYGRSSLLFSSCLHAERVYDAAPPLRAPPAIAELSLDAVSGPQSRHSSRLELAQTSRGAGKPRAASEAAAPRPQTGAASLLPPVGPALAATPILPGAPLLSTRDRATSSPSLPATERRVRSADAGPRAAASDTVAAASRAPQRSACRPSPPRQDAAAPTGWRGMWQSLLHPDRGSREPRHTAAPDALPAAAATATTMAPSASAGLAGTTPDRGAVSAAAATATGAPGCLYDSQSKPVEGLAPFFFHYAPGSSRLDLASLATAARPGAAGERDGDEGPRGTGGGAENSDGAAGGGGVVVSPVVDEARPSIDYIFLKRCGCYVLALAIRKALESQRYPATLVVVTDNGTREGRVHWRHNRIVPLAAKDDESARTGIAPWVLNFVFPGSRLANDPVVREQQERRLFQTIVFQVAGADSSRVSFPAYNSLFFALNSGPLFDSGRLYFLMHLSMPESEAYEHHYGRHALAKEVSAAAYAGLEEIFQGWAMNCTCNEALRLLPCRAPPTSEQR